MSWIGHFATYAAAFEKAYAADDWSIVAPYFRDDAVYDAGLSTLLGGRHEGRAAILDYFARALNGFDRRFETRELALLEGPREDGREVWIRGTATYRAAGVPDLRLELEETVRFDDVGANGVAPIVHLADRYTPQMTAELEAYVAEHGARLGFELPAEAGSGRSRRG